jgi:predicted nucleic acid-binding protein
MRCVIDSSVAYKWEINEPDSQKAIRLRDEAFRGLHELLAPDIWPVEMANSLYTAELRGLIAAGRFEQRLASILGVGPALYHSTSLLPRAATIIRQATTRIGIYDCLYVALAEREGCEFITADRKLINSLGAPFPFIIPLSSLP